MPAEWQRSPLHAVPANYDAGGADVNDGRSGDPADADALFAGHGARWFLGFLETVPPASVAPVYPLQLPADQMIFTSNFNASSNIYMDTSGTGRGGH
ncbi:hypothetical protein MRX96_051789 [Rhipicephalus microplus]